MNRSLVAKQITEIRMPHFHESFPLILFWSQKSGCTTLVKWFFYQVGMLDEVLAYSSWAHDYEFKVYKNDVYYTKLVNALLKSEKQVYKLVRNPYKRAVSSFTMLHTVPGFTQLKAEMVNSFGNGEGLSFKEFLLYLKNRGVTLKNIDGHFAQQYLPGEELFVQRYIYLESFERQIRSMEAKHHLKASPLAQLTKSPHDSASSMRHEGNYANMKTTHPAFPIWPTYESFYNEETKRLVDDIFRQDFQRYGYPQTL